MVDPSSVEGIDIGKTEAFHCNLNIALVVHLIETL